MHASRSPPPLQHPRPQHPPSQIPSTSPPPDAYSSGDPAYQRFSSPPVSPGNPYLHQQQQHQQNLGPDSYIPAGNYGQNPNAYLAPHQHQQQHHQQGQPQQSGWPGMGSAMGGAMGAMGMGGGGGGGVGGGDWPGMNDATTQMGVQFGKHAFEASSAYLDKNFTRLLPLAHLKHSFNVSNGYVLRKLRLVLWPWRHRVWARGLVRSETSGQVEGWKTPRDDVNCPDLYIPIMALVTYILLSAVIAGAQGLFDPSILGATASKSFGLLFLEFLCTKLGCYLLGIGDEGTVVDLFAYEGYKFVGIIVVLLSGLLGAKGWLFATVFTYVFFANFFFLLRSLRHLVLPDPSSSPLDHTRPAATSSTVSHSQRTWRIRFLFMVAATQGLSMGLLVRV